MDSEDTLHIYFASQTGNAEEIAYYFEENLKAENVPCHVIDTKNFDPIVFQKQKNVFFCLATHYNGEAPDSGEKFREWILQDHPKNFLHHMKFGVFAIGDINYRDTFTKFGKDVDKRMDDLGAVRMTKLGRASNHNGRVLDYYQAWKGSAVEAISKQILGVSSTAMFTKQESIHEIGQIIDNEESARLQLVTKILLQSSNIEPVDYFEISPQTHFLNEANQYFGCANFTIVNICELRQEANDKESTMLIELANDSKLEYQTAGTISILPENTDSQAKRALDLIGFDQKHILEIKTRNPNNYCP